MSIYTQLTPDDIVEANPTVVTTGLWSGDTGSLETSLYIDHAVQVVSSGEYYVDVYNKSPANELAEVQFSITYGHMFGGGAPTLAITDTATLPTKAIYSQYKNLLLDPSDTKFSFQGVDSEHIYVINMQRARIREQLDPGNWQLPLSGANGISTFIDDSGQTLGALTATSKAGRVFAIVSGALDSVSGAVTSSTNSRTWGVGGPGYGLVYPDLGVIVLNPHAIGPAVGFFTTASGNSTGSVASSSVTAPYYVIADFASYGVSKTRPVAPVTRSLDEITGWNNGTTKSTYNHAGLFVSLNLATSASANFKARSAETISSTHYFIRLRNKEYNYSNNPTFYNPDNGSLVKPDFRNNPRTYITTVGLYNTQNELLAVAKLSKPVRKSFDEEILLRVRLDF
jgi:hypothetical protein